MSFESLPMKKSVEEESSRFERAFSFLRKRETYLALLAALNTAMPSDVQANGFENPVAGITEITPSSLDEMEIEVGDTRIKIPSLKEFDVSRRVYMPEDAHADKLIVLIQQMHLVGEETLSSKDYKQRQEMLSLTVANQKIQYELLKTFSGANIVTNVCTEGLWEEVVEDVTAAVSDDTKFREFTRKRLAPYFKAEESSELEKSVAELLTEKGIQGEYSVEQEPEITDTMVNENHYLVGGELVLAGEGKISLCPGESKDKLMQATELSNQESLFDADGNPVTDTINEYKQVIYEDREDIAIKNAMSIGGSVVGVTFGAAHDFRDAIARWNTFNPNEKAGLMVIRPNNVEVFFNSK